MISSNPDEHSLISDGNDERRKAKDACCKPAIGRCLQHKMGAAVDRS